MSALPEAALAEREREAAEAAGEARYPGHETSQMVKAAAFAFGYLARAQADRSVELERENASLKERNAELEAENGRLRVAASRDWSAAWHLGPDAAAGHADLLDMVAGEIDCGDRCEYGFTEHDTGSFVCRKNDDGECGASNAALLREIAQAFAHVHSRQALGGSHER